MTFNNSRHLFPGLTKIDHILSHKTNLNTFNIIEILQNVFSDHNGITLEINSRKKDRKISKHVEIKQCTYKQSMAQRRSIKENLKRDE